jgi:hypothetical protein
LLGRKSVSVGLGETGTLVVLIAAPQSHAATQAD